LKYIHEQRLVDGIQHKLLIKLLGYNYKVEFKKGKENRVADALSRVHVPLQTMAISQVIPAWIEQVTNSYSQDDKCKEVLTKLNLDAQAAPKVTLNNGILRYKGKLWIGNDATLGDQLLANFHKSAFGGHSGERATYQRLKLIFYWPNMHKQVKDYVQVCPVCQKNKAEHTPYPGLLEQLPVADMAWTHISMDFIEGLPKSSGMDVISVVVDRFTKYAHFLALSHPFTVQDVVTIFIDNIFKLHGTPVVVVTDRDRIFTSTLWQALFKSMEIKLHLSTAYHPETDSQTERVNQCLENYLRCMCFTTPRKWKSWLSLVVQHILSHLFEYDTFSSFIWFSPSNGG